ncbi:hypothetical protein ACLQ3K_20100 [Tsukamurella sp. DT100]|uniref:hypothetical protein n=1 Tax=Tsukamurella sp. DT100 TaxID=3393415 RepID=UPI003CFB938D
MNRYVWSLDVTYPEAAYHEHEWRGHELNPEWEPANWDPYADYLVRFGDTRFRWPAVRKYYLSRSSAVNRANLLEFYGAKVRLMRSLPIEFEERDFKHVHRTVLKVMS